MGRVLTGRQVQWWSGVVASMLFSEIEMMWMMRMMRIAGLRKKIDAHPKQQQYPDD
jgi:hypothetical protein